MPHNPEAARAVAFLNSIEDRCASRTQPWSLGTAFFHDDFPIKYDYNYLRVEVDDPFVHAAAIAAEADAIQGAAGLKHRKVHAHEIGSGSRLAPGFRKLGWHVTRIVIMVYRGQHLPAGAVEVKETSFDELHPHYVAWDVKERKFREPEARLLADSMKVVEQATDWRLFAGTVEGEVAGWCELFSENGVGQIENVSTYSGFQGRGVARSVIARALEASRAAGNDLHFLLADDDDWPKELYARVGFEPCGYMFESLLAPDAGKRA